MVVSEECYPPLSRQETTSDVHVEVKREVYQNSSMLCCVRQLCFYANWSAVWADLVYLPTVD